MKIRPVGDELFHADGQTNRQVEANSHSRSFVYAPQYFAFCPQSVFMFCVGLRANSDLYSLLIKLLVFITEKKSVYCAVRNRSLRKVNYF
jgi:hypothetical protein